MKKKKLITAIKQATAGLLASAMVLTGVPLGGMTAQAAVLPENTTLMPNPTEETPNDTSPHPDYSGYKVTVISGGTNGYYTFGNSESTAYAFGKSTPMGNTSPQYNTNSLVGVPTGTEPPITFNIGAITSDDAAKGKTKGYYDNYSGGSFSPMNQPTVKSAYKNNWWFTYYGFGGSMFDSPVPATTVDPKVTFDGTGAPLSASAPAATYKSFLPSRGNGGITEIDTPNSTGKVEVRTELMPTDDNENLLLKYTVYNNSTTAQDFWIGNETDTMMYDTDSVPITISDNNHHLYMQDKNGNGNGTKYGNSTFDVRVSGADEARVWGGRWPDTATISHSRWAFSKNKDPETYIYPGDSAGAFSFRFKLASHETKVGTAIISTRAAVYYVDPSYQGTSTGFQAEPFKNINDAVAQMQTRGLKKGYIYLTKSVEVGSPITIPAGLNLQIESSPYDENYTTSTSPTSGYNRLNSNPESTAVRTIKKAANFVGDSLFKITDSKSTLNLYNVKVDGNGTAITGTAPLINVSGGKLKIKKGVRIENALVSGNDVASAILISGSGQVIADPAGGDAFITGNTSKDNGSAVIIASGASNAHPLVTASNINITGNTAYYGNDMTVAANKRKANVNLNNSLIWVETDKTLTGTIGVSVASSRLPQNDSQAAPIADFADRTSGGIQPYTKSNFESDVNGQKTEEADVSNYETGTTTNQITGRIYLTAPFKGLTVSYVDKDGNTIGVNTVPNTDPAYDPNKFQLGAKNPVTKQKAVGSIAGETADGGIIPAPSLGGYVISEVTVSPNYAKTGESITLPTTPPETINGTVVPNAGGVLGNIGGTIYQEDVDVTVKYIRAGKTYKFDTDGGNAIAEKYEAISSSASTLGNLPKPVKAGYDFVKWVRYDDLNDNGKFDTGEQNSGTIPVGRPGAGATLGDYGTDTTPFPAPSGSPETISLYAVWNPGTTPYEVRRNYRNSNPSLALSLGSDADNYTITTVVNHDPATIPCYKYVSGTKTPSSVGTLDAGAAPAPNAGHLHIASMPALNVAVNYKYVVDSTQTRNFTVRHIDATGNDIGSAPPVAAKLAEQPIAAQKQNITGYTYDRMTIDAGFNSDLAHYIVGLDNTTLLTTNDSANGIFAGFMPNQNVTVTFHYNADAGMNLVRKYLDHDMGDRLIHSLVDGPVAPGANVNFPFGTMDELYGYIYGSSNVEDLDPAHTATVNVDPAGNISGNMSASGNGVRVNLYLNHDPAKWRTINFALANAPYEKGIINPLPAGAPTSFLANDGSTVGAARAYSFNKLTAEGYIPTLTPNRYYKFDGWYLDAAATIPVNSADTFPTGTTPLTLYAKFIEDPSQWYDINFISGTNGSISAPSSIHIPYDYTWGQIATQIPTATPVVNYVFLNWKDPSGTVMGTGSPLTNGATYTANFGKHAPTWGTDVGAINPTGRIGSDGSGEIVIDGTTPGNVYVISDPNGNIVAVVPGDAIGNRTVVPNLIPGAHYNVQEGTPDTVATVGQPVSSITGTAVSAPKDVFIPTVDNNYNIGYDPDNDGMAQIVINPADPDADYALIDENGNVVNYPGSDNGWMTPVGRNPSTVTFKNLNPNETYTVVARKKGNTSIPDPLSKLSDGTQIIANPGDMAEAVKYVVETKNGTVVSVKDTSVNTNIFEDAHAGETVTIHADPVDANGKNFLYWNVLAGRAVGVSGNITSADYTFTLSNSNIVLKAVYEPIKIAGDDAGLTEAIRGGSAGEFGLDPSLIPGLAHELTTPLDRSLIGVNGASVDYKVVFNKRDAKPAENTAVKPVSISGVDHPDAYTAAYGLDIQLERYVDGRLVNNDIIATASNATVDVIAQLPAEDVDQLDYQLFDVTPDALGQITPVEVTITTDVANNAGLIKFSGNLLHSYVLVYSKTFKVTFVDNKPVLDHLFLNDVSRNFYKQFKVRRKESVEDSYYSTDYDIVTAYAKNNEAHNLKTPFEDIYGVQYDYQNWSRKEDKLSAYDTTGPVTKRTVLYAYYSDNRNEVAKARVDLGNTIGVARDLTGDPYLKVAEVEELKEAIAKAVETLRQARDLVSPDGVTYLRQANYVELQQAIDALRALIDKYYKIARDRADARERRTGGVTGGGNTSSGRGSKLLPPGEKSKQNTAVNENSNTRAFVLAADGNWQRNPVTGGWSFALNGGTLLNDIWGKISFTDNTGREVSRWYYFGKDSTIAKGWVFDTKNGNWYFMNPNEGDDVGQMVTGWVMTSGKWYYMDDNTGILKTGWHLDPQDGRWYYLDKNTGEMLTGWQNIDGKYYYFNPIAPQQNTYEWDRNSFKWNLVNRNARPYGAMYVNEQTPDGAYVNANGERN